MRSWMKVAAPLALVAALLPGRSLAQPAMTLKFSWDHCAGDGYIGDRTFACDVNTGGEVLVASMVINDGADRVGVAAFRGIVDVASTATNLPSWWVTTTGSCRANAILANFGPFAEGGSCVPWSASSGPEAPLGVFAVQPGVEGPANLRIVAVAAVPAGSEATLPAGQELVLFRISLSHARSTGTDACAGCSVPTCIGFGHLTLQYAPGTTPDETADGTTASAVTWQGAYIAGYAPSDPPGATPYWGNLGCTIGPVPAQGRTWGLIKTMYR